MMKRLALAAWIFVAAAAPTLAQFADQATFAGTGAGTANAQTITLPNASTYADLVGVLIKFVPGATNTAAATLNVNGFGSSPSFRKPSGSGMTALTGGEIQNGQTTYVMYDGTYFDLVAPANLPVGAAGLASSSLGFNVPVNLQLAATVSTNALTIAVKGIDGNNPSASNPVLIPFRDSTIANGGPKVVSLQSALSFTIASGSTMGCVSGQMCRLWVVAICSSGLSCTNSAGTDTLGLCAFNAVNGTSVAPINEAALQSSASGTSGGSSAQTYYCGISSVTAKAIRIIGYVDIKEVTAGTWATGPTYTQLFGPGIKKPADIVQTVMATSTAASNCGVGNYANTALAASITPTAEANLVRYSVSGLISGSGASANTMRVFRGITAIGPVVGTQSGSGPVLGTGALMSIDNPASTSSQTYTAACQAGVSATFPSPAGSIILDEIMGALTPANNDEPLRKVG